MRARRNPNVKMLRAVHPNAALRAAYKRKIMALVDEMTRSYEFHIRAAYRADPPEMAEDARAAETYRGFKRNDLFDRRGIPAVKLQRLLKQLGAKWEARFASAAPNLARYFTRSVAARSERTLAKILRDAGISVKFTLTPELKDIIQASVAEGVSLIKSIQQQYHTQVAGSVMRSVSAGRDLSDLSTELRQRYGVTQRRAAHIALSQNNLATGAITRERLLHAGINEAVWLHSGGGKEPRKTHLANSGKPYNVVDGWFDPDPKVQKFIRPGELINCRCVAKPIVRGFS